MQHAAVLARPPQRRRDVGRDHQDRRARGPRLTDRAERVRRARARRRQRDAEPAGRPRVAVRRVRRGLLVAHADEPDRRRAQRLPQREVVDAGQPEADLHPGPFELVDDDLRTRGHRRRKLSDDRGSRSAPSVPTAGAVIRRTALLPHAVFAALLRSPRRGLRGRRATPRCATSIQVTALLADGRARRDPRARTPGPPGGCWSVANATWAIGDFDPFDAQRASISSPTSSRTLGLVVLVAAPGPRCAGAPALALDGVIAGLAARRDPDRLRQHARFDGHRRPRARRPRCAGDAMIVTTIVFAFALSGWRPARAWWVIAAGETILRRDSTSLTDHPRHPEPRDARPRWVVAFLLIVATRAFHPATRPRAPASAAWRRRSCRSRAGRSPLAAADARRAHRRQPR